MIAILSHDLQFLLIYYFYHLQVNFIQDNTSAKVEPMSVDEALEISKQLKQVAEESKTVGADLSQVEADEKVNSDSKTGTPSSATGDGPEMKKSCEPVSKIGVSENMSLTQSRKSSKQQSANLMQKCIDCFQNFFHELVIRKYIKDEKIVERCFKSITNNKIGYQSWSGYCNTCNGCDSNNGRSMNVKLDNDENDSITTFSTACQLLAEFASFPMYGVDIQQKSRQKKRGIFILEFLFY